MKRSRNVVGYKAVLVLIEEVLGRMKSLGVSKANLAELTGVERSTVSRWFSPGRNLSIFTAAMIADALGAEIRFELVDRAGTECSAEASKNSDEVVRVSSTFTAWEGTSADVLDASAVPVARSAWNFDRPTGIADDMGSIPGLQLQGM